MTLNQQKMILQLRSLSQSLAAMQGEELYITILDVCSSLIGEVTGQMAIVRSSEETVKDVISGIKRVNNKTASLASQLEEEPCMKVSTEAVNKLEAALREADRLKAANEKALRELPVIERENENNRSVAEDLERRYKKQEELKQMLCDKLFEYSGDKRRILESANASLTAEIDRRSKDFERLENEKLKNEKARDEINEKIALMPEEKQLKEDYDKLKEEYDRLLNAKEECSPAKQNELQNKIYELSKEVSTLETATTKLRDRYDEVFSAKTRVDTDKAVFETEFIERLESSIDDLKNIMTTHRDKLNRVKDDADALKKSIDECDAIHKNYRFMFDTMGPPLEAFAKATSVEHENLKKYLDINVSQRIHDLKENIEKDIGALGEIIDNCRAAASLDQKNLERKVTCGK